MAGGRQYASLLVIIAQAMRAILLASATAVSLRELRWSRDCNQSVICRLLGRMPDQAACQLPGPTVNSLGGSSSTGDPRLRGALNFEANLQLSRTRLMVGTAYQRKRTVRIQNDNSRKSYAPNRQQFQALSLLCAHAYDTTCDMR